MVRLWTAIQDGAGKVSGDKQLESEGKLDKAGDLKDAARDAADALKNKAKPSRKGRLYSWSPKRRARAWLRCSAPAFARESLGYFFFGPYVCCRSMCLV
jgi:hypothetical protein